MNRSMMVAVLFTSFAAPPALAASYDGSQPFLCAPVDIVSCGSGGRCNKETAVSLDLPRFLKFDVGQNQITGTRPNGEVLKAAIDKVQHVEDRMVLQGIEGHLAWSVLIGEDNGDMTLTAGGDKVGFVAFGACTQG
jgi:hypothetical protein